MGEKKIKIFNTPWHVAHQYELFKLPNTEWFHIVNSVRKWTKGDQSFRPRPKNLFDVAYYEPGKYDLAILHVDQQCVDPSLGKSRLYQQLDDIIKDIPKIVINHGTPYWPEAFTPEYMKLNMKMLIKDNHMVVNSERALKMWGDIGKTQTSIIHGLDPEEWWDLPKEPRVITTLSSAGLPAYYNRKLLTSVQGLLKERGINHVWIGVDKLFNNFDEYRNYIGRSLVYFNPTLESPMPRSRTEAMLSGCCITSLPNHGAEKFIKQGENGFLLPDNPVACADFLEELVKNQYKKCIEIGKAGKETARELFNKDRFQKNWLDLISKVLEK